MNLCSYPKPNKTIFLSVHDLYPKCESFIFPLSILLLWCFATSHQNPRVHLRWPFSQNIQSKSKVFYKLSHQIVVETLDSEYDTIHILYICDMSMNYPCWVTFDHMTNLQQGFWRYCFILPHSIWFASSLLF